MTFVDRAVRIPGRIRIPYVEQGDPSGVPMILLHGLADSWHSFELVLPRLPGTIHAFALTQRGHGDADRPSGGYRTRDFAADAAGFSRALGLKPAIIVGHSMGSTNALRFATDYPELTRGLVLVASFATYRGNPAVVEFWESAISQLTDPIDPEFVREFQESTDGRPLPPEFFHTVVQEALKVPARVWQAAVEGLLEDDFVAEMDRVKAPTLMFWGDRDTLSSRNDQEVLLGAIKGSRLKAYEGVGHGLHWEEPERFAQDLLEFCNLLTEGGTAV